MKYMHDIVQGSLVISIYYVLFCKTEMKLIKVSSNDCACPGDIVTYECTVFGGSGVTTVWKGNFFHCSNGKQVIEFVHSQLTSEEGVVGSIVRICNNGNIVGRIVRVENEHLTSQLNVTLTNDIAGESIECISDNGTDIYRVGLLNLTSG